MGGGTLHLKVLRREGGGGSSSFRNLGGKWVDGRGGSKYCALWWGGGMDFCWNNPLSQTVLQEEMINQNNIILLQIGTARLCTFLVVL